MNPKMSAVVLRGLGLAGLLAAAAGCTATFVECGPARPVLVHREVVHPCPPPPPPRVVVVERPLPPPPPRPIVIERTVVRPCPPPPPVRPSVIVVEKPRPPAPPPRPVVVKVQEPSRRDLPKAHAQALAQREEANRKSSQSDRRGKGNDDRDRRGDCSR